MEMCYDGALVMPSNYAVMDEEEMTYVEGGYYLSQANCNAIAFALGATAAMNVSTIAALFSKAGVTAIVSMFSTIPVVGWLIGLYGGAIILKSAEQFSSALATSMIYKKGMDISLGFSWFIPYLKCSGRTK